MEKKEKEESIDMVTLKVPEPATLNLDQKDSEVTPGEEENGDDVIERGNWGGQIEFLLTVIGFAVGLGSVWRFPYMCLKNGGGAFLIPYVIMLIFVGMPVFYLELCFGQFASLGPVTIWKISPIFKGIGCSMVSISLLMGLYYNVIIAWSFYFFFASMNSVLPWAECGKDWNTIACITGNELFDLQKNQTALNITLKDRNLSSVADFTTPSEEFFYIEVMKLSDGFDEPGSVVWQICVCLLLAWMIVFLALIKGVQSLGKVVYVVVIFPFIMMIILLVRGATLEGAVTGIEYFILPKWERLTDVNVWADAATQIFFVLSACTGGLIAMSSYNKFSNNCLRDAILVPSVTFCTNLLAGFVIFSVLGFMAERKGVAVDEVAAAGPGLVFVVYPEALSEMPLPPLWSLLFFLMLIMLGFSSEFSYIETVFVALLDEFSGILRVSKTRTVIFRAVCTTLFFAATIPMTTEGGLYLFTMVDSYVAGFPLLFIGIFEFTALNWLYGFDTFSQDISLMIGKRPNLFIKICWCFLSPALLLVIAILKAIDYPQSPLTMDRMKDKYLFPESANILGWLIVAFLLIWIPGLFIYRTCAFGGWEVIKQEAKPLPDWGPALEEDRQGRYAVPKEVQNLKLGRRTSYYSESDNRRISWVSEQDVNSLPTNSAPPTPSLRIIPPQSQDSKQGFANGGFVF